MPKLVDLEGNIIKFQAQVAKVTTLSDNGWSVTLHGYEKDVKIAYLMMQCKQRGGILEIAAVPVVKVKSGRKSRKTEIDGDTSTTY